MKYLNLWLDFFGHVIIGHVIKRCDKVIFKICDVINWEKVITIHLLSNISKTIGNQKMKYGQLIQYSNMQYAKFSRKIKHNVVEALSSPKPFSKKINIKHIPGWTVWNFSRSVFIVSPSEGLQKVLKLKFWPLAFTSHKAFLKNKTRSETGFPAPFSAWLWRTISSI